MYVYVIKFENYPHLVKIGKSVNPDSRAKTLACTHGRVVDINYYHVGDECHTVEANLHKNFREFNSKEVSGDGCTEFFSDIVHENAKDYLFKYALNNSVVFQKQQLENEYLEEKVRYKNLIGQLLGIDSSKDHYKGNSGELYTGWFDCLSIDACLEFGYELEDVATRYISKPKESYRRYRFTTPKRVALAFKLHKYGSNKADKLKEKFDAFSLPSLYITPVAA